MEVFLIILKVWCVLFLITVVVVGFAVYLVHGNVQEWMEYSASKELVGKDDSEQKEILEDYERTMKVWNHWLGNLYIMFVVFVISPYVLGAFIIGMLEGVRK